MACLVSSLTFVVEVARRLFLGFYNFIS